MELENRLQLAREAYVRFFCEKIGELKVSHPECVAELLVEPNGARNSRPFSLVRLDAIHGPSSAPHVSRIAFTSDRRRPHSSLQHNGVAVLIGDISWEQVSISFCAPQFDLRKLQGWVSRWIDDDDERKAGESGPVGLMHSISWDGSSGNRWKITVDFGSAPVHCLLEFIEEIKTQGVGSCVIETDDEVSG